MLINDILFFVCCFLYLIIIFYCTHYIQNDYSCKKNNKYTDCNNYESIENNNFV